MSGRIANHGFGLLFARPRRLQWSSLPRRVHSHWFSSQQRNNDPSSKAATVIAATATADLVGSLRNDDSLADSKSPTRTTTKPSPKVKLHNLLLHGCLSYPQTWAFQQFLLHRRLQQRRDRVGLSQSFSATNQTNYDCDCVVLLELSPVYTLGRGADEKHLTFVQQQQQTEEEDSYSVQNNPYSSSQVSKKLSRKVRGAGTARLSLDKDTEAQFRSLTERITKSSDKSESLLALVEGLTNSCSPVIAPNGVPVYRVDRGGEVTYHGPSQLVVYPLLDLKQSGSVYQADLHWYLRRIEDVIILTLENYGIEGNRDSINTGVWVGANKIAAVGISSSRWITTHGFALNVNPDLACFDTSIILPCGIEGRGVTSMAEIIGERNQSIPTLAEVAEVVTEKMQDVFGVTIW